MRLSARSLQLGVVGLFVLVFAIGILGPGEAWAARPGKILVVLTGVDKVPGTDKPTGFWAEEFVVPVNLFKKAGWQVFVATLKGGAAPVDPRSVDPQVVGKKEAASLKKQLRRHPEYRKTIPLRGLLVGEFAAVFVVGGHGVMWDLTRAPEMADLVRKAVAGRVLVSAVCHGPGALLGIAMPDGRNYLAGREVTGFSNEEEDQAGMTGSVPYFLEEELNRESGGGYRRAATPWQPFVTHGDGLILGQNPASSEATAKAVLETLAGR
ncbi:MAG: type 1 glutamine amidotransferase domain-containing protein [Candidatus Riflebacteria bacterium]|nr:type 1 glutamine amidotransferase domain-containing protein [Candidatus Riflebacteria bacterium]